jgi:hypothetical protein
MATAFPPLAASLLWFGLLGVNGAVAARRPRGALNRGEMLLVYAMWLAASVVAGRGMAYNLLPTLAAAAYYGPRSLETLFGEELPAVLTVRDPDAVRGLFEGFGPERAVPWDVWVGPLLAWACLLVPLYGAVLCLALVIERPWSRHEHLAFPLVALPSEMTQPPPGTVAPSLAGPFFRRPALWGGVLVSVLIHGLNGLHGYFPAVPSIPISDQNYSASLTSHPWTALRPLRFDLYLLLAGLAFLAPTDVLFSFWVFFVIGKLERLAAVAWGWGEPVPVAIGRSQFPFHEEQGAGAYLATAAVLLWTMRRHLLGVARGAVGLGRGPERALYRGYRLAALGFVACAAGVLGWGTWAGWTPGFTVLFFGYYLVVGLVLSRVVAEGGVAWTLGPMLPDKLIFTVIGTASATPSALPLTALQLQHVREYRQLLAPAVIQGARLGDEAGYPPRKLLPLMAAALLLAAVIAIPSALTHFYQTGGLNLQGGSAAWAFRGMAREPLRLLETRLANPTTGDLTTAMAVGAGAAITLVLYWLRQNVLGWPLHPLGYVLGGTMQVHLYNAMWFSLFVAWVVKASVLRFGGGRAYRIAHSGALGLVLGDLLMAGFWKVVDSAVGVSSYTITPI